MSNINNCTFASKKVFDHPQDNLEHGKKAQRFAPPSTKQAKTISDLIILQQCALLDVVIIKLSVESLDRWQRNWGYCFCTMSDCKFIFFGSLNIRQKHIVKTQWLVLGRMCYPKNKVQIKYIYSLGVRKPNKPNK